MSYFVTCTHEQRILNGTSSDTSLCHWGYLEKKIFPRRPRSPRCGQIWPDLGRLGKNFFSTKKKKNFPRSGQIWAAQIWRSGQIWQHPCFLYFNPFFFFKTPSPPPNHHQLSPPPKTLCGCSPANTHFSGVFFVFCFEIFFFKKAKCGLCENPVCGGVRCIRKG